MVCSLGEKQTWNWIEKLSNKTPTRYHFIFLILVFFISYLIYIFLISKIDFASGWFEDYRNQIPVLAGFFWAAYLIAGVAYFTDATRMSVEKIKAVPKHQERIDELRDRLRKRFTKSKTYYVIIFLVIISDYLVSPIGKTDFWYFSEPTIWSILIDVFNIGTTLLILYLMATILWINLNVSWTLDELASDDYISFVKIDLFHSDTVGGLSPLKNLIRNLAIYQFVTVTLGILNWVTPGGTYYKDIIYFYILYIINVYLFLKGQHCISKILTNCREYKINNINQIYEQLNQQSYDIIARGDFEKELDLLDQISKSMNLLQFDRDKLQNASRSTYNFKDNFIFLTSSLLPFVTTYVLPYILPYIRSNG